MVGRARKASATGLGRGIHLTGKIKKPSKVGSRALRGKTHPNGRKEGEREGGQTESSTRIIQESAKGNSMEGLKEKTEGRPCNGEGNSNGNKDARGKVRSREVKGDHREN